MKLFSYLNKLSVANVQAFVGLLTNGAQKSIRSEFAQKEFMQMLKIMWWDWNDEKIAHCHEDFMKSVLNFTAIHSI